jgi:hypothetical protein
MKNSGRKLVASLVREHGDDRNIVFIYWYENEYKHGYYDQYAEAFFKYHRANEETHCEFQNTYEAVRSELGRQPDPKYLDIDKKFHESTEVPIEALETLGKFDQAIHAMVTSQEDSWNFAANPCFVKRLSEAKKDPEIKNRDIDTVSKSLREYKSCIPTAVEFSRFIGWELPTDRPSPSPCPVPPIEIDQRPQRPARHRR